MDNNEFYTKGNPVEVITRIDQVHTITIYCPLSDICVQNLKDCLEAMLQKYRVNDLTWKGVPAIDALNAFVMMVSYQQQMNIEADKEIIGMLASSLKMFPKMKKINFVFTDDPEIRKSYDLLISKKISEVKKYIYKVELLEIHLDDYFSQGIIDMLNKVFICNELIPNSYLDRKFSLTFTYDDYISFMDMFINNNRMNLNLLDSNICDYFRSFPKLITEQKPDIRLITNYSEI